MNIRAENVARTQAQAKALGVGLRTDVFASRQSWQEYAVGALRTVEQLARELGLSEHLHLWPDSKLGTLKALQAVADPAGHLDWLKGWWKRTSQWPS